VNCPNCGSPNEPNRKFCGECGTSLAAPCPVCGATNAPGVKFCGECGTDLRAGAGPAFGAATAPTAAPATTAERRLVSVLFADLVGFTTISEARDPEVVRELLSRYFGTARQIIGSYGGTIEKFIGDAVMAVWGSPTAHEDDAERAVRTALDLVEAVRAIGDEIGADLRLRAGVLTGGAAVTLGAANEGMVAGDLVNTASRLQSVAPPGTVLVGESTFQAASGAVAFEPAGDQILKGKSVPVPAYRALRVVARRGGAGRSEQLEAPFVGRAPELRMLKDFHTATAAERRPRLVSIMGQGGIGKSRLVWEFQKYMDGVTEVVYWHQGRSPAYGEGISFWALAEMVRSRASISEADAPATTQSKLSATVGEWVTDDGERRWIEPRLLQLLGIETADSEERPDRESLFAAWRLVERILERAEGIPLYAVETVRMLLSEAEFAIRIGDWAWAISELEDAVASLETDLTARLRRAELLGLQGAEVDDDIQAIADRVADATEVQWQATVDEVRARVTLGHGDAWRALDFAQRSYRRLIAPDATNLQTAIRPQPGSETPRL
jgi:class 3 adenylate cyclase